mmetsp:Transcript_4388/g.12602  ORF Transcript_4388/g.12602 Transcript_4388/m.12602 type:complete len:244 (+) Transcript_4388:183-914(+)
MQRCCCSHILQAQSGTSSSRIQELEYLLLFVGRHLCLLECIDEFGHFFLLLNVTQSDFRESRGWQCRDESGSLLVHHFRCQRRRDGILDVLTRDFLVNLIKTKVGKSFGQVTAEQRNELFLVFGGKRIQCGRKRVLYGIDGIANVLANLGEGFTVEFRLSKEQFCLHFRKSPQFCKNFGNDGLLVLKEFFFARQHGRTNFVGRRNDSSLVGRRVFDNHHSGFIIQFLSGLGGHKEIGSLDDQL